MKNQQSDKDNELSRLAHEYADATVPQNDTADPLEWEIDNSMAYFAAEPVIKWLLQNYRITRN